MSSQNAQDHLLELCRNLASRFGHVIELMRAGRMSTHGAPGDPHKDTTADTIVEYEISKAELETTIAKIESQKTRA